MLQAALQVINIYGAMAQPMQMPQTFLQEPVA
jgi:hypothetical protein